MYRVLSNVNLGRETGSPGERIHEEIREYAKQRGMLFDVVDSSRLSQDGQVAVFEACDAVILDAEPFTRPVIENLPALKAIVRFGVGCDAVDVAAASARGIPVMNTPGANTASVAEHALTLILCLLKNVVERHREVEKGVWSGGINSELQGKTVALIGFGKAARRLAELLRAFSCDMVAHDVDFDAAEAARLGVRRCSLEEALARADIVSLHLPLTGQTRGLVDREFLGAMKSSAYFVNTSRGGIVDEEALAEALEQGDIAGAGLDVFESEPLPTTSRLLSRSNVLLSPHAAGDTYESCIRVYRMAIDSIARIFNEEPVSNLINPEYAAGKLRT